MKRFAFWFILGLVGLAAVRANHRHVREERDRAVRAHRVAQSRKFISVESNGKRVVINGDGVSVSDLARNDDENDDRVAGEGRAVSSPQVVDIDDEGRVTVEGLPVPVVPGTRTTEAVAEPPKPPKPAKIRVRNVRAPKSPVPPRPPVPPKPPEFMARVDDTAGVEPTVVAGLISATEDRARANAFARFRKALAKQLAPDVPPTWNVPERLVKSLKPEVTVTPHPRDYGTMYTAEVSAKVSPGRRAKIVEAYRHERRVEKLTYAGGGLGFLLVCLGVMSGYIRADVATKGYYTNKLRLAAAAGVGAAGVLIYQAVA